jgi:hypothetical protein
MVKCPLPARLHSVITQRPKSENENVLEEEKEHCTVRCCAMAFHCKFVYLLVFSFESIDGIQFLS